MPDHSTLRRFLAAAAVLPALAVVAGCGGGDSASGAANRTPTASTSSAAVRKPAAAPAPARQLTAAQLTAALLGSADIPGLTYGADDSSGTRGAGMSHPDKPGCLPLVEQLNSRPKHIPTRAYVSQSIADGRAVGAHHNDTEFLATYAPGGAAATLAALHSALATCKAFTATDDDGARGRLAITRAAAPAAGDDAVAFRARGAGAEAYFLVTVVRTGAVTSTFVTLGAGNAPVLPSDIPVAQDGKLRAAHA